MAAPRCLVFHVKQIYGEGCALNPERKGKRGWRVFAFILAALLLLAGYMVLEADTVRVEYADVYLSDLPEAFDGTRILFLSDIHVDNFCPPEKAAALVNELGSLKPDLLLLGGDYSALDALDYARALTGGTSIAQAKEALAAKRDQFFLMIRSFEAKLGKYAVAGNHDYELEHLDEAAALGGVKLIRNAGKVLTKDGQKLIIAGLDDWKAGMQDVGAVAQAVRGGDCVILLSHNPDALPSVIAEPAADGALWADLALSGHTHGGQVALFGWSPFSNSIYGRRYMSGWYEDSGALMLVSNGVGTTGLPLRLGAPPRVHVITLNEK